MKRLNYLFLFLLMSCAVQPSKNISGVYVNQVNQFMFAFDINRTYSIDFSLKLNADSTFVYQTCQNTIKGNWGTAENMFLLKIKSRNWKSNSCKTKYYNDIIKLKIKNDGSLSGKFEPEERDKSTLVVGLGRVYL